MRTLFLLLVFMVVYAVAKQPSYAIGAVLRTAKVPYQTLDNTTRMDSLLPLFFYEGKQYYMRGLEAGVHLYKTKRCEINVKTALRFVDMPRNSASYFSNDTFDSGVELLYETMHHALQLNALVDLHGFFSQSLHYSYTVHARNTAIIFLGKATWQSESFNSYYYGFSRRVDAGIAMEVGTTLTHQLSQHWRLYAKLTLQHQPNSVREQPLVHDAATYALQAGILVGEFDTAPTQNSALQWLRVSVAQATFSSFSELLSANFQPDPYRHRFLSLAYDYEVSPTFAGYALPLYLHSLVAHHGKSSVQQEAWELVSSFKLLHSFSAPFGGRIGMAEGLSYVTEPTYVEQTVNENDGYNRSSRLLNFLEFSLEYALSKKLYVGYALHHRSGVFQSVQSFNQIKGGSNYHSITLSLQI